ncbi:hypothetical protein HYPSUDRAFT_54481 [Hypholoma sublateritium FD-334 SS-4]|uniref:DUF6533 domain-containing protein n=1 Tax=Hypholoma sublateritium (strain FD-334 SS-4) TaxID=945553 RepID=A0A0D2P3Q5_HYPSF|nr:hypothetical protein HYPSUDRAFT_54481 [Hypholoma sublateritium FD-334 SS-4]
MGYLIGNYMTASAITVLVYEIVASFDREIDHIWRSSWSIPKALYLFSRYYPLIYLSIGMGYSTLPYVPQNHTPELTASSSCQAHVWYRGFGGFVLIVPTVSMIFFFRVAAIYGNKPKFVAFLVVLFLVPAGLSMTSTHLPPWVPTSESCLFEEEWQSLPIYSLSIPLLGWVPPLGNSALLFVFTLLRLWSPFHEAVSTADTTALNIKRIKRKSPILSSLFTDGIVYFFLVFTGFSQFTPYLYGARLILNLREIATKDFDPEAGASSISLSTFAAQTECHDFGLERV